jgi:molecular chaperone GrpE
VSENTVENEPVMASEDVITEVVDERSEVERQRDEYLDALQRLQADFENYRKRVTRSSEDAAVRAAGDVVVKLLPVIDAFDLALAHFADATSDEVAASVRREDCCSTRWRKRDSYASTP